VRPRLLSLLALTTCTPDVSPTTMVLSIYGEDYIEDEIPAADVVDGWSVMFDSFVVSIGALSAADDPFDGGPRYRLVDLSMGTAGAGVELDRVTLDPSAYRDIGFRIAPAADAVAVNVGMQVREKMFAEGLSLLVSGTARRGPQEKHFLWGFTTDTVYSGCESTAALDGSGPIPGQITLHGDHLFHDDLFSDAPGVAFDLIAAADIDGDDNITEAELRAVDIRTQERYQVGDLTSIKDLWSFIEQQTATLGHFDGEGHCDAARVDGAPRIERGGRRTGPGDR
jgi:hypothetical protein